MYTTVIKSQKLLSNKTNQSIDLYFVVRSSLSLSLSLTHAHSLTHTHTHSVCVCDIVYLGTLRKHAYSNTLKILQPKTENFKIKNSGPSCSKLTTSLVNDSLKFTSSDTQIC